MQEMIPEVSFQLVGIGSCWNANQDHPPYETGSESSNDVDTCFEACRNHERYCTGFDTREGCLFYFDDAVTQNKVSSGNALSCYKIIRSTVESTLGTENERLKVANKALRQALEELTNRESK